MAEENKFYLTEEGYKEAKERLDYLRNVANPEVIERIEIRSLSCFFSSFACISSSAKKHKSQNKIAKEQGDLSENAEYHAAREEQGKINGEIEELTYTLKYAVIIKKGSTDKVSIGCKVKILDLDMNEEAEYYIVGTTETDLKVGKISNESALGEALLGAKKGETVTVKAPNGSYEVKILDISQG